MNWSRCSTANPLPRSEAAGKHHLRDARPRWQAKGQPESRASRCNFEWCRQLPIAAISKRGWSTLAPPVLTPTSSNRMWRCWKTTTCPDPISPQRHRRACVYRRPAHGTEGRCCDRVRSGIRRRPSRRALSTPERHCRRISVAITPGRNKLGLRHWSRLDCLPPRTMQSTP